MSLDPFDPVRLKTLSLRNRFVLAAAASGRAADESGVIRPEESLRLSRYADFHVGLIITGAIGISETSISHADSVRLITDEHVAGLNRLCDEVHARGGKIAAQLCHSGIWTGRHSAELHQQSVGPSRLDDCLYTKRKGFFDNYREATRNEIWEIIRAFGKSAARAEEAGFDAVEVHAAHDSLLAQFLSPLSNRRTDEWGGSLENRVRLHREVGREIRRRISNDFPVILKLGVSDGIAGGLEFDEGREAAHTCVSAGYDILEISQGLQGMKFSEMALRSPINTIEQEGFTRNWCREITRDGAVTIMTGGLRSWELIEGIVKNGEADGIGLCRPLICEPGLIGRWKAGDWEKSACTSCNRCAMAITQGLPLACYRDIEIC
jgi:2,4-dienoyl-CoA reductase-like NADH-dependent reductase (Old Yellow Enzyme family)